MIFHFTMNMPARNGNQVHQVIGGVNVKSLNELLGVIAENDFLIVQEYYVEHEGGRRGLTDKGPIALNPMFIGKIKESRD